MVFETNTTKSIQKSFIGGEEKPLFTNRLRNSTLNYQPPQRKGTKKVRFDTNDLQLFYTVFSKYTQFYDLTILQKIYRVSKNISSLLLLLLIVISGFGQTARNTDYSPDKTLKSNARVNPSTLAMELSVPIAGYPGRAGNGVPITFDYTSKVWEIQTIGSWMSQYGSRTDTKPVFAKRKAAGWSSSLHSPRIDSSFDLYDGSDNPATREGGYVGQIHSEYDTTDTTPYTYNLYSVKRLQVEMPDGSSHEFRVDDSVNLCGNTSTGCAENQTGTYLSVDGSKMRLERNTDGSATLYLPDGGSYSFAPFDYTIDYANGQQARSFTDRNGNKMTYDPMSRQWTDTLGRVFTNPFPLNWQSTQEQTVGDVVASFPGLNGGTTNATFSWRYLKDPNGGESGLNNPNQSLHHLSSIGCQGNIGRPIPEPHLFTSGIPVRVCHPISFSGTTSWTPAPPFNPVVLTKITLANGQSYQFKYNVYGEIEKIIYPSGGYERFAYTTIQAIQNGQGSYEQANRGVTDRWLSVKGDGTDEQHWTYQVSREFLPTPTPYKVITTNPDGTKAEQFLFDEKDANKERPYGFDDQRTGRPFETRVYSANNQLLRRSLTAYEVTQVPTGENPATSGLVATRDIRPVKEISITFEPNASSALASMTETIYDSNGDPAFFASLNPKQSKIYHYVAVDLNTAQNADINTIAALFSSSNLAQMSEMDYLYDENYKARNIVTLPVETRVKDAAGNVVAKSQIAYDEAAYGLINAGTDSQWVDPNTTLRGNPTTSRTWTDVANNQYVETHAQFDNFGNARKTWDAKGNLSEVEFSAAYKYAYPTKTISTVPDPSGQNGSNTAFETTLTYDLSTGLTLTTTDVNGQTSSMEYNDPLLRPTKVIPPAGGAQTVMEYTDTPLQMAVKTKTQIDANNWAESTVYADGLGRTVKSEKKDDAGNIFSETEYDTMGRVKRATNPFRNGETKLWTENTYDDLSRVIKVKTPDNAEVTTSYGLSTSGILGTIVTATDQSGKQRRSLTNGLGQLIRVDEPDDAGNLGTVDAPVQPTSYAYDTLNNLTTVNQGVQTRTFVYDSLSRLKQATNPESGTISYAYDANGNLTSKTDARSVVTNYLYDNLNRVTQRSYSDGTPQVAYTYDDPAIQFAKGRLTKVASSVSETRYNSFDNLGRVLASQQITDGNAYNFGYAYNLAGMLTEETYPSGRKVRNTFQSDGDLQAVDTQTAGGAYVPRAGNFTYTSFGAVSAMQLGNGRWENAQFNSRLQPVQLGLGLTQNTQDLWKVNYDYGQTDNNGNVRSQTITVPNINPLIQTYAYDSLNRIKSATETENNNQTWKQTFQYDRYGNRNFDVASTTTLGSCPANQCNPSIDAANNRFTTNQGYTYDLSGNLITDAQNRSFIYDAENTQKEVKDASNNPIGQYFYDGDGKRVKKVSANDTTLFIYDASGKLAAEYQLTSSTPTTATTSYLTSDTLGSPRVITDQAGNVTSRRDFMPFGEEIAGLGNRTSANRYQSDSTRQKFTGYERDNETELDFAQARIFGSGVGRFTSPDPLLASARRIVPQSWNRYVYVLNNPLIYVDPSGLDWGVKTVGNKNYYCFAEGSALCKGYTRYKGDGILTDAKVNGKSVGAIKLLANGGWERVVPVDMPEYGLSKAWVSQKDVVAINAISNGALCSLSGGILCMKSMDDEISGNVTAAGDAVQLAFVVKALLKAGVSLAAIAMILKKGPDDIRKIAYAITKNAKIGECEPCALALETTFKSKGIQGEVLQLQPKGGGYWSIFSDVAGVPISSNGKHFAVKVGDLVFDNIHKKGRPYAEWLKDFSSAGPGGEVEAKLLRSF